MRFIFPIYLFQIYPIIYFLKALHSVYIEQFITVYPDFKASIDSPRHLWISWIHWNCAVHWTSWRTLPMGLAEARCPWDQLKTSQYTNLVGALFKQLHFYRCPYGGIVHRGRLWQSQACYQTTVLLDKYE